MWQQRDWNPQSLTSYTNTQPFVYSHLYPSCFTIFTLSTFFSGSLWKTYSSLLVDNSPSSSSGKLFKLSAKKFVLVYFINVKFVWYIWVNGKWLSRRTGSLQQPGIADINMYLYIYDLMG